MKADTMVTRTANPNLPGGLTYLNPDAIVTTHASPFAPRNPYAMGYGHKIPTRYRVTLTDKRTRRVYAMCYGNAASLYVIVGGKTAHIGWEVEHMLEVAEGAK